MVAEKADQQGSILGDVIRVCRRRRRSVRVTDTTGAKLTGGDLLVRALVLRRLLRRQTLAPDEQHVGVLLPPTAAGVAVNLALALDRRIAVNLNYTLTAEILNGCLAQAGIRHVLTSRAFLEKVPLRLDTEYVYLEDFREAPTPRDKLTGAAQAYLLPAPLLMRVLGLHRIAPDDVLTIIFTSGTTDVPKGVILSHGNIATNVSAVADVIRLRSDDTLIGVLPFFHAFGYTATMWAPLALDVAIAYHVNPLEARQVGKLCREQRGTILLAAPMFLRTYVQRCEPADFATLEAVIAGGERLPSAVADAFMAKFKLTPVEGYGTTETSPIIAANIPPNRAPVDPSLVFRPGTVGKPVPGVRVRVTDLESGEELEPGQAGMLWVSGPNVMQGYLGRPEATAEVIRDGWYKTGDIVEIDADGFIRIVGRQSRFAKIGSEMVPHAAVEEALANLVGVDEEGGLKAVVVSVPDPAKGERLVVVHVTLPLSPDELVHGLAQAGLPNLFIPAPDSFVLVDELPHSGSGKLDIRQITRIAQQARRDRRDHGRVSGDV
ncbi:MAG TPA: AMP-binding protein [Thermomicrobiales bacterium]|nr:AMP-binding protein [Thermomicrobiales bacterium]